MALGTLKRIRRLGPGVLVTAAFIGPGTVTTASLAGVAYKSGLLWCVAFSTLATIILQEMAARLGLVARQDLCRFGRLGRGRGLARRQNLRNRPAAPAGHHAGRVLKSQRIEGRPQHVVGVLAAD